MRNIHRELLICVIVIATHASLRAQSPNPTAASASASSSASDAHSVELERKLEAISSALAITHQQLEQSQHEMEQLREELAQIKKLLAATQSGVAESPNSQNPVDTAKATAAAIEALQEEQQTIEANLRKEDVEIAQDGDVVAGGDT